MTDKEALVQFEKRCIHCHNGYEDTLNLGEPPCDCCSWALAISALRDRIAGGWISVEDPPKQDGFYIVYMLGDIWGEPDKWGVTACGFYDGQWDEDGATISHWQPLPAPPSEEGERKE